MSLGKCPHCKKPAQALAKPFCSKRCADLDLGAWLSENYRLPGSQPASEEDLEAYLPRSENDPL